MKNRVAVGNILDGTIGKYLLNAAGENLPFVHTLEGFRTMEVVTHEEAATQEIFAKLGGLIVMQQPMPDLDSIGYGPVVDVVGSVQIDDLFDRAGLDAGQTTDAREQVPV